MSFDNLKVVCMQIIISNSTNTIILETAIFPEIYIISCL